MFSPAGIRVVFMGSPEFAVPSLGALIEAGYNVVGVLCQPDKPVGRSSKPVAGPVKQRALGAGIPVLQPEKLRNEAALATVAALEPDVFVVAAYGKIIPNAMLGLPTRGSVNVHASLLPRWRGASPIEAAILEGDAETGVTIMEVVQQMDAGDMVAKVTIPILPTHTTATLEPELAIAGATLLVDTLPGWFERTTIPEPQDQALVTMCGLIRKEDGQLRAGTPMERAWRMVRAYNPWPGMSFDYDGSRMTAWQAHPAHIELPPEEGRLLVAGKELLLGLRDGWLALDELQRPGGKRMPAAAFLNGERSRGGIKDHVTFA